VPLQLCCHSRIFDPAPVRVIPERRAGFPRRISGSTVDFSCWLFEFLRVRLAARFSFFARRSWTSSFPVVGQAFNPSAKDFLSGRVGLGFSPGLLLLLLNLIDLVLLSQISVLWFLRRVSATEHPCRVCCRSCHARL
jgi:hypothetical protein